MRNGKVGLWAVVFLFLTTLGAFAQTTGTNMVTLIKENIQYAETNLVPVGIGLTALFIAIAIGVKIYRKTVKG